METPTRARRGRRRRTARTIGGALLALGTASLLYAAFELWGTGYLTARAQAVLRQQLASPAAATVRIPGRADGILEIPRIALDVAFVEGISPQDLAKGPGHYPETPLPGQGGNTVIAGHRTTHGVPFWALDALRPGDRITIQTRAGTFGYRVASVTVRPDDAWAVTLPTRAPSLTLTTCNPRFSSAQRLVVRAVQVTALRRSGT